MESMIDRNGKIGRAPGFEDRAERYFEQVESLIGVAREVLYTRGYQPIETPLIEQTELFLRRSGGLLSSQLFDFVAPDGSDISLRPELTAPVVRHVLEQSDLTLPKRFQYASPIFRYAERPYDAPPSSVPNKRQFIQIGAELVGDSHSYADAEIIAVAYELARRFNVRDVSIRVGHVGLIREILGSFDLSERARLFLANSVAELAERDGSGSVEDEAIRLGLMPAEGQQRTETQASAADLLSRLASGSVRLPGGTETVSRSAEDIVAGLRRKVEWDASNADFPAALELIEKLATIRSSAVKYRNRIPEERNRSFDGTTKYSHSASINSARLLADENGLKGLSSLDNLTSIVEATELSGVDGSDVSVDFGLSASIAYYSGMIFEVRGHVDGKEIILGGGGRYDGLASALGSPKELPALGFALNLETILDLVGDECPGGPSRRYVVLSPIDGDAADDVVATASELRSEGKNVVTLFDPDIDADVVAKSIGNASVLKVGDKDDAGSTAV